MCIPDTPFNSRGEYTRCVACVVARLCLGEEEGGANVGEYQAAQDRKVAAWFKE